ncbi:twin-arginine translocase TatA/TatE family subunit [Paraburkholderia bannensis]|uniref:twin-arginine translocase TatA/TatE family subunit n=1 Tax=Paraburkholderia bannensis TaxID=765414 RepID=UPI002AB7545A|nr:twin-arginine translocase TatA/TatE family subunit [Paraburkholderia bannensis]
MLDFALSKMAVIGVVSLVVLGPERLPRVARTSGALLGRAQRYIASVREEVTREIELAEIKQAAQEVTSSARLLEASIREGVAGIDADTNVHTIVNPEILPSAVATPSWEPPPVRSDEVIAQTLARRRRWRSRQVALPQWYKRASTPRRKVASGAARAALSSAIAAPGDFA